MTSPALADSPAARSALTDFQTHGQDIPGLLAHWAAQKPDHPALVWSPREGRSYDEFSQRLPTHLDRLKALKVNFRPLDPKG